MARVLGLLYGVVSYAVFLLTFLYSIAFVGNIPVTIGGTLLTPVTIDGPGAVAPFAIMALVLNLVLLSVFALQHSIMARPAFKEVWTKFIPKPVERSTYVLLSSGALILMFAYWEPISNPIWTTSGALATALTVLFWAGWALVLTSTFLINHFDLFGLKQVWENMAQKEEEGRTTFVTRGFYKVCRHPIMLGFIIAFWATPVMTLGHLLFAFMTTAYIMVALIFEEKDLITEFGDKYERYQRSVSQLIPLKGVYREETETTAVVDTTVVEEEKETTEV